MFVLREVHEDGRTVNFEMGGYYEVTHKVNNEKEFNQLFLNHFGFSCETEEEDDVGNYPKTTYGFIQSDNGLMIGLQENHSYYVMTEKGTTFEKII